MKNEALYTLAEQALPDAARCAALTRPLGRVLLSDVYGVAPGWESAELPAAEGIVTVDSREAFDRQMALQDTHAVFVKDGIFSSRDDLAEALRHVPYCRTIYYALPKH